MRRVRVVEVGYRRRGSISFFFVKIERCLKTWGCRIEERWGLSAANYVYNKLVKVDRELARLTNRLPIELESRSATEAAQRIVPQIARALGARVVFEPAPRTIIEIV